MVYRNSKFSNNNISILQWNCRSIRARFNDLSFLPAEYKCQFVLLSETWLLPNSNLHIPHFHVSRRDRIDSYGGVAIVSHQSMNIKPNTLSDYINRTLEHHSIDLIGIEVIIKNSKFELWSIYIPPFSNPNANIFNDIFSFLSRSPIIGGDFNGHHSAWGSSASDFRGNLIHSSLSSHGLCILNTGCATRINRPPYPDTAIDLSASFPNFSLSYTWSVLINPYGSDHCPILINMPDGPSCNHVPHNNTVMPFNFNFNAADWTQFTYHT